MPEKEKGLAIYVGKDRLDIAAPDAHMTKAQIDLLSRKTPAKFIKKRKGRGGKELSYVEVNYVQAILNAVFAFDWDVKVIDRIVDMDNDFIAMLVELTLRFADGHVVTKHAWGGADIKHERDGGRLVDFADDLKAAESDGIKKAASMAGVAWDVFSGLSEWQEETQANPMLSKFYLLKEIGEAKATIEEKQYYDLLRQGGFNHANEVPPARRDRLLRAIEETYFANERSKRAKETAEKGEG